MVEPTANPQSVGAGQQDPNDSNNDFAVISFIVRQMMAELDTMKLAKVVKVSPSTAGTVGAAGTVDVQLLVNNLDGSNNSSPNGIVYGLPYFRLGGGKNAVLLDPVVEDVGFVVCSDRDISNVKTSKKQGNPGSFRKYNIADGVYVGGILSGAPDQYVRFTEDTVEIHDKTGNVVKLSSTGIDLTPSGVLPVTVNGNLIVIGNLQLGGHVLAQAGGVYGGNIATSGEVTAGTVGLKTHTHTQAADSHGDAEQPTSAPVP
jgi:hypothetical protein